VADEDNFNELLRTMLHDTRGFRDCDPELENTFFMEVGAARIGYTSLRGLFCVPCDGKVAKRIAKKFLGNDVLANGEGISYTYLGKSANMLAGAVLRRAVDAIETAISATTFFKIGITFSPLLRGNEYLSSCEGYTRFIMLHVDASLGATQMLEAALISHFCKHAGCQNKEHTGGEGLSANTSPPYFCYVAVGPADQMPKSRARRRWSREEVR
jgi:hypothetical protein